MLIWNALLFYCLRRWKFSKILLWCYYTWVTLLLFIHLKGVVLQGFFPEEIWRLFDVGIIFVLMKHFLWLLSLTCVYISILMNKSMYTFIKPAVNFQRQITNQRKYLMRLPIFLSSITSSSILILINRYLALKHHLHDHLHHLHDQNFFLFLFFYFFYSFTEKICFTIVLF